MKLNKTITPFRTSCLLALKLKETESKANIDSIRNSNGKLSTDPKAINDTFKALYSTLYSSEVVLEGDTCKNFLQNHNLPLLSTVLGPPRRTSNPGGILQCCQIIKERRISDEITPELYLAVWDIVRPLILNSMNYGRDQNVSLVILSQKKMTH